MQIFQKIFQVKHKNPDVAKFGFIKMPLKHQSFMEELILNSKFWGAQW